MESVRKFKGVWIPSAIFLDANLTAFEKMLWADINSFTALDSDGYYKRNKVIAKQHNVSVRTVTTAIANLLGLDLIEVSYIRGYQRVVRAKEPVGLATQYPDLCQGDTQNLLGGMENIARGARNNFQGVWQNLPTENTNREKPKRVPKKKQKEVVELPWDSTSFGYAWAEWVRERTEVSKKYTVRAQRMALKRLQELSENNEIKAIEIIQVSLANSWKGFYPLKKDKNNGFSGSNFTPEGIGDFVNEG